MTAVAKLPVPILRHRKNTHARLNALKTGAFQPSELKETLSLINNWFSGTRFDGIVYEEKDQNALKRSLPTDQSAITVLSPSVSATRPQVEERRMDEAESAILEMSPKPFASPLPVTPLPQTADTIIATAEQSIHLSPLTEVTFTVDVVASSLSPSNRGTRLSETALLLEAVHRRLSVLETANQYRVTVNADKIEIQSKSGGHRTIALGAKYLLKVSKVWLDEWDRRCIAVVTADGKGTLGVAVADICRCLVLGIWSGKLDIECRKLSVEWGGECVVGLMMSGANSSTLMVLKLPTDETDTCMTQPLTCAVPCAMNFERWELKHCREGGLICVVFTPEVLIGDIYSSGRALWCRHGEFLSIGDVCAHPAKLNTESLGSVLNYLLVVEKHTEYCDVLQHWLMAVSAEEAMGFLQHDMLSGWILDVLKDSNCSSLKMFTVTRWRSDLLEKGNNSVPKLVRDICVPVLAPTIKDKESVYALMMKAEGRGSESEMSIACNELMQHGSLVIDIIIEACLLIRLKQSAVKIG